MKMEYRRNQNTNSLGVLISLMVSLAKWQYRINATIVATQTANIWSNEWSGGVWVVIRSTDFNLILFFLLRITRKWFSRHEDFKKDLSIYIFTFQQQLQVICKDHMQ